MKIKDFPFYVVTKRSMSSYVLYFNAKEFEWTRSLDKATLYYSLGEAVRESRKSTAYPEVMRYDLVASKPESEVLT